MTISAQLVAMPFVPKSLPTFAQTPEALASEPRSKNGGRVGSETTTIAARSHTSGTGDFGHGLGQIDPTPPKLHRDVEMSYSNLAIMVFDMFQADRHPKPLQTFNVQITMRSSQATLVIDSVLGFFPHRGASPKDNTMLPADELTPAAFARQK